MNIRVDRIAAEGEGIGKVPGSDKVAFVPYGLPGDRVEGVSVEEKARFVRVRIQSILEPAPGRIEPRCSIHFFPGKTVFCGGCDWQHAEYAQQLRLKRDIVVDCLRRIAKLQAPVADTIPSPRPWRYRNKVQVPFQSKPGEGGGFVAGFYGPGSHRVVEFEDCVAQSELSVAVIRTVKEIAAKFGWPVYEERKDRGWLRHLYVRTNEAGEAAVVFVTRDKTFAKSGEVLAELTGRHPQVVTVWQNVQEESTSVILGPRWRKLWGKERLRETIGPLNLEFSPGSFVQVNTPAAAILYGQAERMLFQGGFKPRLVLDLYCGVGAMAFWIARGTEGRVIGVEESPQAVEDAYWNARRLGVRNVAFIKGRAEVALRRMRGLDAARPWGAIVDPPRSGCDLGVLRFLSSRRVERIVYVSCNPATFARDARILADAGYRLETVQPVDLFPQTSHVELAAQFNLAP